jgi:hypothetical protein
LNPTKYLKQFLIWSYACLMPRDKIFQEHWEKRNSS